MPEIQLTAEQWQVVSASSGPVKVCAPTGQRLGEIGPPLTEEEIAEFRHRVATPGPTYTWAQTLRHLKLLDEALKNEPGYTKERMFEILEEIRTREP